MVGPACGQADATAVRVEDFPAPPVARALLSDDLERSTAKRMPSASMAGRWVTWQAVMSLVAGVGQR